MISSANAFIENYEKNSEASESALTDLFKIAEKTHTLLLGHVETLYNFLGTKRNQLKEQIDEGASRFDKRYLNIDDKLALEMDDLIQLTNSCVSFKDFVMDTQRDDIDLRVIIRRVRDFSYTLSDWTDEYMKNTSKSQGDLLKLSKKAIMPLG